MPDRGKTATVASVRQDLSPVPAAPGDVKIKTTIKRRKSPPPRRNEPKAVIRRACKDRLCSIRSTILERRLPMLDEADL